MSDISFGATKERRELLEWGRKKMDDAARCCEDCLRKAEAEVSAEMTRVSGLGATHG